MVFLEWSSVESKNQQKLYTSQQKSVGQPMKKKHVFFFVFWYGIFKLDFIINGNGWLGCLFFLEDHHIVESLEKEVPARICP